MGSHIKAKGSKKGDDHSFELAATDSDAPILPVEQIERLHAMNPDWAHWVIDQATKEAEHRRSETKRANTLIFTERMFATTCAFIVALAGFALSAYVVHLGNPIVGSVAGGFSLVALVTAFIKGRQSKQ